ncbi:MAG: HlyD family efflux transporter periplasmic adaptor subunit [Mangrovibacterium sp.]|nr:HlyD family efflux transporter periplasmic adaptor subunit [Mangrovibacterium sp.]
MKPRVKLIALIAVPVLLLFFILVFRTNKDDAVIITTDVVRGVFDVQVFSSGQIESENKTNIPVPAKLSDRSLRIWRLKITELVEEGTYVDSGAFVARLDPDAVQEQIKGAQDELDKAFSDLQDARIDSNLNLSNQRDVITNALLDKEEKSIIVKESVYESPSIRKKADMDYDKAERKVEQEKKAYLLKREQEENKVNRQQISFRQLKERFDGLEGLYRSLTITSPKAGIVTYVKNPWGVTKVGSEVSGGSAVATIPDMRNLISRTYINEIDISKVKEGQPVTIGIDAFPEKEMKGEVVSIANIGQSMPNSDARVFEVKIKVFGDDADLKPAMTTSNIISTNTYPDTLFIPADAVFENDSLQFVYLLKDKVSRQIVKLGEANENFVLVAGGLNEGDRLCLTEPENPQDIPYSGLEIYAGIKKERAEKEEAGKVRPEETSKRNTEGRVPPGGMIMNSAKPSR